MLELCPVCHRRMMRIDIHLVEEHGELWRSVVDFIESGEFGSTYSEGYVDAVTVCLKEVNDAPSIHFARLVLREILRDAEYEKWKRQREAAQGVTVDA